jgi:hypothetical protein
VKDRFHSIFFPLPTLNKLATPRITHEAAKGTPKLTASLRAPSFALNIPNARRNSPDVQIVIFSP